MRARPAYIFLSVFVSFTFLLGLKGITSAELRQREAAAAPVTPIDRWECFNIGTADPCQRGFSAVKMLSATEGWAVGYPGRVFRWNGSQWDRVPVPTDSILNDVDALSSNDVWIVGFDMSPFQEFILHWDGSNWTNYPPPKTNIPQEIDMVSPADGLVAGLHGILRWNGSSWIEVDSRGAMAVDLLSATDGWVVGAAGLLMHWDGITLTQVANPWPYPWTPPDMWAVEMVASNDVWAVGNSGSIWHWDGSIWSVVPSSVGKDKRGISMVSANDGWIVAASGEILHWDGSSWSYHSHNGTMPGARDVDMVSASDGWIAGGYGTLNRWDGNSWASLPPQAPPLGAIYNDVHIAAADDGWAVGQTAYNYRTIIHWDGQDWAASYFTIGNALQSVDAISATDGWAVGDAGVVMRWDGTEWTYLGITGVPTYYAYLYGVSMVAPDDVWAVGGTAKEPFKGLTWHWDGVSWNAVSNPSPAYLYDVEMVATDDGWAVGDAGMIMHWNGSQWVTNTITSTINLKAVDMISATEGWAAGNGIVHWDGNQWSQVPSPAKAYYDIAMPSASNGWATGYMFSGTQTIRVLVHWDGNAWTAYQTPTDVTLNGIAMISEDAGWAVGTAPIFRYNALPRSVYLPVVFWR